MSLTRRQLIHSTLGIATALGVASISGPTLAHTPNRPVLTFYDPRFQQARAAAEALAGDSSLSTVTGDVTELAPMLAPSPSAGDLVVAGVTTESVPFCLQQLAGPAGAARLDMRRLDRDLFAWKLTVNCP